MSTPTPQQGDVLVIGTGEKATRHELCDYNQNFMRIDPPIEGLSLLHHVLIERLLKSGAATLERKKERYQEVRTIERGLGSTLGNLVFPKEFIGKTVEIREVSADHSTYVAPEGER